MRFVNFFIYVSKRDGFLIIFLCSKRMSDSAAATLFGVWFEGRKIFISLEITSSLVGITDGVYKGCRQVLENHSYHPWWDFYFYPSVLEWSSFPWQYSRNIIDTILPKGIILSTFLHFWMYISNLFSCIQVVYIFLFMGASSTISGQWQDFETYVPVVHSVCPL